MELKNCKFPTCKPIFYRWSGKYVGYDENWQHMERQLVDYELIVMEKGTLYIADEWGTYEVHEGEYLLMEPTSVQKGVRPSKCRFYWMHFLPEESSENEQNPDLSIVLPKGGKLSNVERLFNLMKQLQDTDLRYMDGSMNNYLATAVLYEVSNQMLHKKTETMDIKGIREQVDEYVLSRMTEPISVGEIAAHFGYHEKYFSTMFKEKTGMSVKQYVDTHKVERAKYLLLNTDAWNMEIAEHLGYDDIQNFYHVFKRFTNCTPGEYRATYSIKQESTE